MPLSKAYYVERLSRSNTTVLVYATNLDDAKTRVRRGEGTAVDTEHRSRGIGAAWRAPDEDGKARIGHPPPEGTTP